LERVFSFYTWLLDNSICPYTCLEGGYKVKQLEIQMILFVGATLAHEYWQHWGLPRVYYWDVRHSHLKKIEDDSDEKIA
jgi:hypothetical protein